jgi:hypothetical protein
MSDRTDELRKLAARFLAKSDAATEAETPKMSDLATAYKLHGISVGLSMAADLLDGRLERDATLSSLAES